MFARSAVTDILGQEAIDGVITVLKCDHINHVPHFDGKVEEAKDPTAWTKIAWSQGWLRVAAFLFGQGDRESGLHKISMYILDRLGGHLTSYTGTG